MGIIVYVSLILFVLCIGFVLVGR